jgi:hypothetical protein
LPGQPIFYPVVQEEYARKIARDWNAKSDGAGYVTRFEVVAEYLGRYQERQAGGKEHTEYWIPAELLEEFNDHIVGRIEVVDGFVADDWVVAYDLAADCDAVALVQRATLTTKDFGLVPEVGLFGSNEWWAAVGNGRIRKCEVRGRISRLFMTGHGDWPEFEVVSGDVKTTWTRLGRQNLYVEGHEVRVEYVWQRLRRVGLGEQKQILRVLVRNPCDASLGQEVAPKGT